MTPSSPFPAGLGLALYQPDIPQNLGAIMRLCACMGMDLHIIEPCGFPFDDRKIKRSGMDYIHHVTYTRHESWDAFCAATAQRRLVLMTTKASQSYLDFAFQAGDILLAGQESSGVPESVHAYCESRVKIAMHGPTRSLNIGMACAIISSEAIRQLGV